MNGDSVERRLSGLTIRIDRRTCIGSGSCVTVAPEVFELDSTMVVSFCADAPDVERERLIEACGVCPVDALSAFDGEGKSVLR
jgi:ferredoxin